MNELFVESLSNRCSNFGWDHSNSMINMSLDTKVQVFGSYFVYQVDLPASAERVFGACYSNESKFTEAFRALRKDTELKVFRRLRVRLAA